MGLSMKDVINKVCPWSGDPVQPEGLTQYRGAVVGFCNAGCRDKFERAVQSFDLAIKNKLQGEANAATR